MKYQSQARTFDQADLDEMASRAASGFAELGVGDGDAVGLCMVNEIEVLACNSALATLGAYSIPIPWHSSASEVAYIAQDARLAAVVVHDALVGTVLQNLDKTLPIVIVELPEDTAEAMKLAPHRDLVPQPSWHSWTEWLKNYPLWPHAPKAARPAIIYTSGTTGKPKGVLRASHTNDEARAAQARDVARVWGAEPGMRTLVVAPLYHSAPSAYVRATIGAGGDSDIHFMPRFDPEAVLRTIEADRISHMWMVPTMFIRLLALPAEVRDRYDISSMKNIVHSGAPCPVAVKLQMIEWFGPVINEFYGSTEIGPVAYATSEDYQARPGTVGRVLDSCVVEILDADGQILPPGQIGEIAGANSTYAEFTYHNRQSERDAIDASGLVLTGDIGLLDEDGFLFLKDRKKDMVIAGGVNLYPAEIEDVLLQLSNVGDGAAFGLPDEVFGERLVAAVTLLRPEEDVETRLDRELREHLSASKVPRKIFILEEFPRSDAGKVSKARLREMFT